MSNRIGIMQGRLTPPNGKGIQFFPFENWIEEFYIASEINLDEIEFIFDYDKYEENPLWSQEGISQMAKCIKESKVQVRSICFDYFMRRAFYKEKNLDKRKLLELENIEVLNKVLSAMKILNIKLIEIPLVDESSLKTDVEKKIFADFLINNIVDSLGEIKIGLETDLPPVEFKEYLDRLNINGIGANYDSGNSSGLGYDAYEEVTTLGEKIFNVHIKDRKFQGTTVQLGTGSADFDKLFQGLNEINYNGSFILQAARDEEGKEKENIIEQISFVKKYINRK